MREKTIRVLLLVGVFMVYVLTLHPITKDTVHEGKKVTFGTSKSFFLESDSQILVDEDEDGGRIKADNYFLFVNGKAMIYGQPEEPETGSKVIRHEYLGPKEIRPGRWDAREGLAFFSLKSESTIKVTIPFADDVRVVIFMWFLGGVVAIALYWLILQSLDV